ncbi:unnamed protein product [Mytilus coruscus]|uniref:Heme NO-binding domain-containing protein n=1 Tax=Mytilus coruscus TaxID=42192 RepID=A0A6J8D5H7_MYTCO|nr:unnamed protein product [Mytilus coruscus]
MWGKRDRSQTTKPKMIELTQRCETNNDGTLTLHYYSKRSGLYYIILGVIPTIAIVLYNQKASISVDSIIKQDIENGILDDHVTFTFKLSKNDGNTIENNKKDGSTVENSKEDGNTIENNKELCLHADIRKEKKGTQSSSQMSNAVDAIYKPHDIHQLTVYIKSPGTEGNGPVHI